MADLHNIEDRDDAIQRIRALLYRTTMAGCSLAEAKQAAETILKLLGIHCITQDEINGHQTNRMPIPIGMKHKRTRPQSRTTKARGSTHHQDQEKT